MATSVPLGYPLWCDGMDWSSLLSRQLDGGVATWDTNASATAVNPLGGVFGGTGNPLQVTQQASPNMSVLVNAGYVAVPHPTAQHGVYLFGLQSQSTLTIAGNVAGSNRLDLIIARVYDTNNSSSYCDIEVVQGTAGNGQPATPTAAFLLAVVTVVPSASSIANSAITDKRTFTVAPGGILPTSTSAAPPLAEGQVVWNTSLGLLQRLAAPLYFTETFTASGTWQAPDFVTSVQVVCTGGGGGGGGGFQDYQNGSGGESEGGSGGGGGEEASEPALAVTPGHIYTFTVGTPGGGGLAGTNDSAATVTPAAGSPGTATTFTGDAVTVTANPGQGGQPGGTGGTTGGLGGTGSTNTSHQPGGQGGAGNNDRSYGPGGGGGASGTPSGPGEAGQGAYGSNPGQGGQPADSSGGGGGGGGDYGQYGGTGGTPGGGGGGGWADAYEYWQAGGAGGGGAITLSWVVQPATLTPVFSTDSSEDDLGDVNTSAGNTGLNPGVGSSYGWGIGYGVESGRYDADNGIVPQIQVTFDADGQTDFQFDLKWGLAVPEAMLSGPVPHLTSGQCRIILQLDGTTLDMVYLRCGSTSAGVTQPGDGGAWTYYTSAQNGTTPSAGAHTVTLATETRNTYAGESGAHVGDLASTSTASSAFGSVPSYFTNALVAENCSLRVAGITAAAV